MTPPFDLDDPHEEPRVDDSFIESQDLYDQLLKKMVKTQKNLENFTFMTLNYDCLLERAICRTFFPPQKEEGQCLCTHVHYPFIGGPTSGVEVLKLHGSINWIGNILGNPETDEGHNAISYDENNRPEYNSIEVVPTCIGRCDDQDPSELIMGTYAPGKPPQANPQLFQEIQRRAMERISEAQNIKIIGVHIPPNRQDDPSLCELFQAMQGKNVEFVNPSEKESNLAKSNFDFRIIKKSFKEFAKPQS
jgi:hypothetical protein